MGLQGKPMKIPQKNGPMRMKPKDAFYRVGTGIHRTIFNVSKGRIFGKAFGMPLLELVTTGRRSGKERSTMLSVPIVDRSEEHTSELQSRQYLVCRLLLEKKKK